MRDDIKEIVKKIAFFQEELKGIPKEGKVTKREEFTLLLSGISACRKVPGIPGHMGYQSLYHCESEEDALRARKYLKELYQISNRNSLQEALLRTFSDSERYKYYMTFWVGAPLFDLERLGADVRELFLRQMEMARSFYPVLKEKGFYAWDINEKIGLCRKAAACGIISDAEFWEIIEPFVRLAQVFYHSWEEYAISCLGGAVFFMRREEDELLKFLDLNIGLVRQLFEKGGAWREHAWYVPGEREWVELFDVNMEQECLVTKKVLEEQRVGYLYRVEPEEDFPDCGWRVFTGDESEDYIADPEHIVIESFSHICNIDPTIMAYFNARYGKAYEKKKEGWMETAS